VQTKEKQDDGENFFLIGIEEQVPAGLEAGEVNNGIVRAEDNIVDSWDLLHLYRHLEAYPIRQQRAT
jgi:hypothetical protein